MVLGWSVSTVLHHSCLSSRPFSTDMLLHVHPVNCQSVYLCNEAVLGCQDNCQGQHSENLMKLAFLQYRAAGTVKAQD